VSAVDVAAYFLDTSTVVKRYVQEIGTAWVQSLTSPAAGHALFLVRITLAEVVAAVTRRERGGSLAAAAAAQALADFQYDFAQQYFVVDVSAGLVAQAAALARTHGLRGYDAVQLAAACEVHAQAPSLTLLSADADLNTAAAAEGLRVDDPNRHP
jgi:predicted nucleic acid-binding protein